MQIKTILILLLTLPPVAAGQKPADYCVPAKAILATVQYCFENIKFVEHAEQCLAKLDSEVAERSRSLNVEYRALAEASGSAQNAKFKNTKEDLSRAKENFKALLNRATQARSEILQYESTLIYSGNPPLAFLVRHGLLASHKKDPCHRDNARALKGKIAALDTKIRELKQVEAKVSSLHQENTAHQRNLRQGEGAERQVATTFGSAKPKAAALAKPQSSTPSTITGDVRKVELK